MPALLCGETATPSGDSDDTRRGGLKHESLRYEPGRGLPPRGEEGEAHFIAPMLDPGD
jgi:hypothetical protein